MNIRIYSHKKNDTNMIRTNIRTGKYSNIFEYPNIRHTLMPTSDRTLIAVPVTKTLQAGEGLLIRAPAPPLAPSPPHSASVTAVTPGRSSTKPLLLRELSCQHVLTLLSKSKQSTKMPFEKKNCEFFQLLFLWPCLKIFT